MRIPLGWLKEYVDLKDLSTKEIGDAFTQIGLMTDKPFDGKVFDLEHRFDRSDWLSILGCARDLAAYLRRDLKLPKTYTGEGKEPQDSEVVKIAVENTNAVNRFNTRVFRGVKVKPSPDWLRSRLEEYGIPSINNIVDITNYVMVELGQPMHAQDLAKFRKQEIVIRGAKEGEKLVTFLGEELNLVAGAFVLTQDGTPTVLGGIVGGRETGVDETTQDIILDAGNYNQNVVRSVSRKLKIQNETVLRYDKFLHPALTQYALERATALILELAGGDYYQNADWNRSDLSTKEIVLRRSRILKLGGFDVPANEVQVILNRLGYKIESMDAESYKIVIPYFRTDVEVEDDVVSDILRINGYSRIPTAQIQSAPPKEITPDIYTFENTLRDLIVQVGGHEHITDPLISLSENGDEGQIGLENSQNVNKNALRTAVDQTLKEVTSNYIKNRMMSGTLFEIGMIYKHEGQTTDHASYHETRILECLLFNETASPKELSMRTSSVLGGLLESIGISDFSYRRETNTEAIIMTGNVLLGTLRYNGFTLFTETLLAQPKNLTRVLTEMKDEVSLDVSLVLSADIAVGDIIDTIRSENTDITKVEFLEEYTGKITNDNQRSILLKTYFKPHTERETAISGLDKAVSKLEKKGIKKRM